MNNKEYNQICNLLLELQNEFISEEDKLKELSKQHSIQIEELEQQIYTARKNEDIDFRVFSPRNVSGDVSEKIQNLEEEKSVLEKERLESEKKMGYYTDKSEKIQRIIILLDKISGFTSDVDNDTSEVDSIVESDTNEVNKKPYDPFAFLHDDEDNSDEDDKVFSKKMDEVEALFRPSSKSGDSNYDEIVEHVDISSSDDNDIESSNSLDNKEVVASGVPVTEVQRVCHKVEFTEKIIKNDLIRAKIELKEVISELNEMINAYK